MSAEARRGCGYRKLGGLYLVADGPSAPCCKFPLPLTVCPCCGAGIAQSRGWTWIEPAKMFEGALPGPKCTGRCPMLDPSSMGERAGLLWIGAQFYPTVDHFQHEASAMGISRRLHAIPRGFVAGETWVFLAHPRAVAGARPGAFAAIRPRGFELIVTQARFDAATANPEGEEGKARDADAARGIKWIPVPGDDPAHQGSVFDKDDEGGPSTSELPLEGGQA